MQQTRPTNVPFAQRGSGSTLRTNVVEPVHFHLFDADTVTEKTPDFVGVPETTPVFALIASPDGRPFAEKTFATPSMPTAAALIVCRTPTETLFVTSACRSPYVPSAARRLAVTSIAGLITPRSREWSP